MKLNYKSIVLVLLFAFASFLRLYDIAKVPPGLYIDEASIGYNAYSILTTGKDEHGVAYPFVFQAFGEYKMPVYIYLTAVSFDLFGKNEFAVRLPSAFFGSLTVLLFYFFAKELISYEKRLTQHQQEIFAFVSTFLLAISPWHLQLSRAGFEATVGLFFFLAGLLLYFYFIRGKNTWLLFASLTLIVLTLFIYDAYRIIAPVSITGMLIYAYLFKKVNKKALIHSVVYAFVLALPIILFSLSAAGQARFLQTSAFTGNGKFALLIYPLLYLQNYLSHFSLTFLFSYGDGIGRQTVFRMGLFYKWELLFLFIGLYYLFLEKKTFLSAFLTFLFFVSPLAAALALPSPHALRSLPLVLPLTFIIAYGITRLYMKIKYKMIFVLIVSLIIFLGFLFYLDRYYDYTAIHVADWGGQYKELLQKLALYDTKHKPVVINNNVGMSYVYGKFYDPTLQVIFVNDTWEKPANWKNILYVTTDDPKANNTYLHNHPHSRIDQITTPDIYHTVLYTIWKI